VHPCPVVVVGAGPVGLTAAAHLARRGIDHLVLEAGDRVGASVLEWGHVRLFSPWRHVVDPVVAEFLAETGTLTPGAELLPTGADMVTRLLEPLASHPAIAPGLRLDHRVEHIGRLGLDRMKSPGRTEAPFELIIATPAGRRRLLAGAVIDASGTWRNPNPAGAGGMPAAGEETFAERIRVGIPDVSGAERSRYLGRKVAVVGSGHSAFHSLLELLRLKQEDPSGSVQWILRGAMHPELFGGGAADGLPARGVLGRRLHRAVAERNVEVASEFRLAAVELLAADGSVGLLSLEGKRVGPIDEIIVATGFRPDISMTRELRLRMDEVLECPAALAPLIDPNEHSCGSVPPHGHREVGHPEQGFYTVGMKSYGRAPTFLLLTGYEQVRSVVAAIAGDLDAADQVRLVLPETGVCQTGVGAGSAAGCC